MAVIIAIVVYLRVGSEDTDIVDDMNAINYVIEGLGVKEYESKRTVPMTQE